ncbi:MAG: NAD-dependent epimerase/dehydratase family protein [Candidatus Woesearchaeota archaeon]
MKCLVTGGAGFIGSNLCEELLKQGNYVVAIDDLSAGRLDNLDLCSENPSFRFVQLDVCGNLNKLFSTENFDVVFHLAARPRVQYSIENPVETHNINVNGTLNVLDACRIYGVPRFVFSSSGSIYGDQEKLPYVETMEANPLSPYAFHKHVGEGYCNLFNFLYGTETVSLRYFNVYGKNMDPMGAYALLPGKVLYNFINDEKVMIYGTGENTRDFTFVGDVVRANICAATTTNKEVFGQTFNVGAGDNKSVNYVVEVIRRLVGKGETVNARARLEPKDALADFTKARMLLSWEPKTKFEDGIKTAYEYFNQNK